MKWIAMFSQSGSEIVNISKRLGRTPDMIATNNMNSDSWHPELMNLNSMLMRATNKTLINYLMSVDTMFVTLHGYLRILPGEVVNKHIIINGHPGDIVKYPELKGKDPQQKAIDLGLDTTGVVLHKVTAEVDAGEIISRKTCGITPDMDNIQLINKLKELQLEMWCEVLKDKLCV